MSFNELHPTIQAWSESDEFIDSLVSITTEFDLISSSPLLQVVFSLFTKEIKPEEFKEKLLASLPEDERNEIIVNKLVNLSLLPIKGPLLESGIDISVIAPLDESSVIPYVGITSNENSIGEESSVNNSLSESLAEEPILKENNNISKEEIVRENNQTPIEISPVSPVTESNVSIDGNTEIESPASSLVNTTPFGISPASPIVPENPNAPLPTPTETNSSASSPLISPNFDSPTGAVSPFVIHQEKTVEQAAASDSYVNNPLRPVFYETEPEAKEDPFFASLEFGKSDNGKKIDPANIVDLKDLPL